MSQKVISLDIETMAVAPVTGHPSDSLNKFGLSYVAPITEVALYCPDLGALVLNATDDMVQTTLALSQLDTELPIVKFLRELLSQSDMTLIGHNVVFDLRQLGGHYQFQIHPTSKVFDTMTLAVRMMLAEPDKRDGLSLMKMGVTLGIIDDESPEYTLYSFMKPLRENINRLAFILSEVKEDAEIWQWAGGYIPPSRPILLDKLSHQMIDKYVALDAYYPYQLYLLMNNIVEKVAIGNYHVPGTGINFMRWTQLPGLMEEWQTYLTSTTNQSIRGLDVNVGELESRYVAYKKYIDDNISKVAYTPDPNEKYPDFDRVIMMLMYYEMVLKSLKKGTAYTNVNKTWKHWEFKDINPLVLGEVLSFDSADLALIPTWVEMVKGEGRELTQDETLLVDLVEATGNDVDGLEIAIRQFWVVALKRLDHEKKMSKTTLKKLFPSGFPVPVINLVEWVRLNCYDQHSRDTLYSTFLAQLKLNWMRSFIKMKDDNVAENIIGKNSWKPYYMYCICDTPLPSHDEFVYHPELTTDKFKKHIKALKDQGNPSPDYSQEVVKTGLISVNKHAMAYFLGGEEGNSSVKYEKLGDFGKLQSTINLLGKTEELLAHSRLDGKIHSVIIHITRTGRDSSTLPNLQNQDMKEWAGVFIAPTGFTLLELDYANAENKSGAMISRDNNFAMSTESGDFHTAQAATYWSDIWDTLTHLEKRVKRGEGKAVTFGVAYGMGVGKLATTLQITVEEAKEIINKRKRAYPLVIEFSEDIQKKCNKRWVKGFTPAWVGIWDNSRIQVPIYYNQYRDRKAIAGNKVWNYLQQSSVAAMVHRSIVRVDHHLREKGYKTYIALNVHDSIILCVNDEEYMTTNVVQEVLQLMCNIVPEELCNRTFPPVHFVSEIGPENSQKWGKRIDAEYPFPKNEFINQWGKHPLPDDMLLKPEYEWEAPTWVGPVHEGWTLEKEMVEIQKNLSLVEEVRESGGLIVETRVKPDEDYWGTLNSLLMKSMNKSNRYKLEDLTAPKELSFLQGGKVVKTGLLTYSNYMLALEKLYHAGIADNLISELVQINESLEELDTPEANDWRKRNGFLLDLISDIKEPVSS